MKATVEFQIGDEVFYRNPCTGARDQIVVTGIQGDNNGHQRFHGILMNGPLAGFFGTPTLILGAKVSGIEDVIRRPH